jgi:hypothetical protein
MATQGKSVTRQSAKREPRGAGRGGQCAALMGPLGIGPGLRQQRGGQQRVAQHQAMPFMHQQQAQQQRLRRRDRGVCQRGEGVEEAAIANRHAAQAS